MRQNISSEQTKIAPIITTAPPSVDAGSEQSQSPKKNK